CPRPHQPFLLALAPLLTAGAILFSTAAQSDVVRYQQKKYEANLSTVTIAASGTTSPYTQFAEDIRNVLDDSKENTLRVLPILGRGGGQNLLDILFLRGVDMGIVDQDQMAKLKAKDPALYGDIEYRVHYIAKLMNSEFQVLARHDIKTYADLEGKKVNFFKKNSSTAIGAENIFNALGIKVEAVYLDQALASEKLRAGEISAMIRFAGAPHAAFKGFKYSDGFHFVPLSPETLPNHDFNKVQDLYLPALLKHDFYPDLIPEDQTVATVANSTLLAVYAWPEQTERYRKVANFVKIFFDNIEKFHDPARHVKWKEINLAASVKGWTRFKAAQEWIDANAAKATAAPAPQAAAGAAAKQPDDAMKTAFEEFLNQSGRQGGKNTPEVREALFEQFAQWWEKNGGRQAQ
ncbi:MAG: TAXI family TRAP transporter solute-binding subunit, partial [Pseudomonadota bacterium]|nr:TAXI family TRAP transporter solute-binding subunit [Pseudomonadota bacterium]